MSGPYVRGEGAGGPQAWLSDSGAAPRHPLKPLGGQTTGRASVSRFVTRAGGGRGKSWMFIEQFMVTISGVDYLIS